MEELKNIFINNQETINELSQIMDNIRKDIGTLQYDKSFSSANLYQFSKIYPKIFNNNNVRISINYNNIKFFGLYTSNGNRYNHYNIFYNISKGYEMERSKETIFIEIDNMLLSSDINSITIVKLMIIETFLIVFEFERENIIRYISGRVAVKNGIIKINDVNELLVEFVSTLYINSKCSTFRAINQILNRCDRTDIFIIKIIEEYAYDAVEFMIMSRLKYNDIDYNGFNCSELLNFISDKICSDDTDSLLLQRIEMVSKISSISIVKSICNYASTFLRDISNLSENTSIKDKLKDVKENIKNKYEHTKALNKIRSFNKLYSLYSNKFYEIEVRSKNINDEYTALVFVRDINSIVTTLEEYLFENSDTLTRDNKDRINDLIYDYNLLRQDLVKKKIPKYSTLGIWIPKDYDRNPYDL